MPGRLYDLEKERRRILRNVYLAGAALLVVAGAVSIFTYFRLGGTGKGDLQIVLLPFFVAAGVLVILVNLWIRPYKLRFKTQIICEIVRFVDENLNYEPTGCISEETYMFSELFKTKPSRYKGDDLVTGRIGQTNIQFSEIHAEYRSGKHQYTIFKGLFFIADFNKNFRGSTFVLPDVAENLLGRLGQKLQTLHIGRSDLIKLDDPEFEKYFVVYGDDQIEARYILSPSLMRQIVEFMQKRRTTVCLSFKKSRVYVAVSYQRDLFEPALFQTLLNFQALQQYFQDLQLAIGVVEDLNLNTRIWGKS